MREVIGTSEAAILVLQGELQVSTLKQMSELDKLWKKKQLLSKERDLCAEFYNLMLSKQ